MPVPSLVPEAPDRPAHTSALNHPAPDREHRGFWIAGVLLVLFPAAASAPSPLYGLYAERWSFSASTLTTVFAVYAFALLAALLLFGTVSDLVGRKPVVLFSLAVLMISLGVFASAENVVWLYVARVLQGTATGLVTAAASAWLLDLQPASQPQRAGLVNASFSTGGLALGALYSGILVQDCPLPRQLVYLGLLGACVLLAALIIARVDETRDRVGRVRPTLQVGVPAVARRSFIVVLPCLASTWATAGLYLSLAPSLTLSLGHSDNRLLAASSVVGVCGAGSLACFAARNFASRAVMRLGCATLLIAILIAVVAVDVRDLWLFVASSALVGIGFGIAFLGALRTLIALAAPNERGALVAAVYSVAYLAFSVPAIAAGILATHVGVRMTTVGYGIGIAALATIALLMDAWLTSSHPRSTHDTTA